MRLKIFTKFDGETLLRMSRFGRLMQSRWKLQLSPRELPVTAAGLPEGKSLQDIFADFIRYLFDFAKAFIQEYELMGEQLWEDLKGNIDLVLSRPNGWEGREQEFLRKSVVQASVLTEEEAPFRVSFVTEGEATLTFCVPMQSLANYSRFYFSCSTPGFAF